jgi:protein TonB
MAAPETMVMIDLPPEPELPPLESVEQAAVEEVQAETPPEMIDTAQPVDTADVAEPPDTLETAEPDMLDVAEPPEELAAAEPEPVEPELSEPDMLPPSEVAVPLPPPPPPEMVETAEVKPEPKKPEQKKPERKKPVPKKPPPEAKPVPPADAQAAGAGAGRQIEDALAAYRSSIRRAIVGKRRASDADGATGRAVVQLSIGRDGSVVGLAVSGPPAVAAAAERLVRRVGTFPPIPNQLPAPFKATVPIEFVRE